MTTGKRLGEFGKREPAPLSLAPGPKRSSHVALLVMGTLAVGGGAYALMPRENCQPAAAPAPGMAVPVAPATGSGCTTRTSSGSGSGASSHYSYFSGSSYGGNSSSAGSTASGTSSGGVTRGGFGSFAHAFGFGGS